MLEDLSNSSFRAILDHIQTHLADFLKLPRYKQTNVAEKAVTRLVCTRLNGILCTGVDIFAAFHISFIFSPACHRTEINLV